MTIASGIFKQLRYKKEVTWGVAPGATGAQLLRRTTSDLNMVKNAYESNEMRSDFQVADMRHGIRSVNGNINGELSPLTYVDFFAAILRKAAVAGVSAASLTITSNISAKTFTRSTGSWLTDGFKVGDVVRFSGYTAGNVGMNARNYRIATLTATIMTVADSTGMVDAAAVTSISCAVTGKKIWVPTTGHTDDSFSIEHYFADLAQSELFTGCKVNQLDISLPATGMSTIGIGILGKGVTAAASAYYTSPSAETTTSLLTGVSGKLRVGGADVANVTAANLSIQAGLSPAEVVGSNDIGAVFPGRVRVSGEFSAYFEDVTMRDAFINETEIALHLLLTTGSAANADFLNFVLPRLKLSGATKDDGEKGLIQTIPFTALLNTAGGTGLDTEKTTISIQDSAA